MLLEVLKGVLSLANTFIAVFIVIYAFLFLKKTKSHKERRPWDYLVIASIIYLVQTVLSLLFTIYGVTSINNIKLSETTTFFQFIYTGLILLAFISQTDLIFKNEIIVITRKVAKEDKKKEESEPQNKKEKKKIKEEEIEEKEQDQRLNI